MSKRLAVVLGLVGLLSAVMGGAATAHPLGNFTINVVTGIEVGTEEIVLRHVVDMAEIATFQEMDRISPSGGAPSTAELQRYADRSAARYVEGISLKQDGARLALRVTESSAAIVPGQGGLDTLRVESTFAGELAGRRGRLTFENENYSGRLGWKEIVARPTGGQGLERSSVPTEGISDELRAYPDDLLSSPLDQTTADLTLQPGAASNTSSPEDRTGSPGWGAALGERFASLVERDLSPGVLVVALLIALAAGALHALGPGHGKTIMAAYLVGAEGKMRHAVTVGIAVSLMHTLSVVLLGVVTLWAASIFPPENVYPWLTLISGVVVLGLGTWLLGARVGARRAYVSARRPSAHRHGHDHEHGRDHDEHHHHHDPHHGAPHPHSHGGVTHTHEVPAASPMSWKGLTAIAVSGGLLPSPTALVVLLGAVALHRVAYGIALVTAFSIGLAGALTIVGILVLKAKMLAQRRLGMGFGTLMPVISASAIFAMGVLLTARAAFNL